MDLAEGVRDLHEDAERDHLREIERGGDHQREYDRSLVVGEDEGVEPEGPPHEGDEVVDNLLEPAVKILPLVAAAVVDGYGLGILADPHQRETEVSLKLLLVEVEADERASDDEGEERAYERVGDAQVDQVPVREMVRVLEQILPEADELGVPVRERVVLREENEEGA